MKTSKLIRFNKLNKVAQIDFTVDFLEKQFYLGFDGTDIKWQYEYIISQYNNERPNISPLYYVQEKLFIATLDYLTIKNPNTQVSGNIFAIFFE
jgi:hypothetical protein